MRDLIVWINETPWSVALRESQYLWTLLEASHVLTVMVFVGTIIMVDLRLLGVLFRDVRVSEMLRRVLPWSIGGFAVMATTGLLLFYAKPLLYYHNVFFRLKMIVVVAGLVNILVFHKKVQKRLEQWDSAPTPPGAARASAAISLVAWLCVMVSGRMIAYDFFNCDKLPPDGIMSFLASCPAADIALAGG